MDEEDRGWRVGRVGKKGNFEFFVDYRGRDRGGGRDLTWFAERGGRGRRKEDGERGADNGIARVRGGSR